MNKDLFRKAWIAEAKGDNRRAAYGLLAKLYSETNMMTVDHWVIDDATIAAVEVLADFLRSAQSEALRKAAR